MSLRAETARERSDKTMEFFRNPKINFVGGMKPAFTISAVLVLASIIMLIIHQGPRLSIDFTLTHLR